jgi:hypothetical protein
LQAIKAKAGPGMSGADEATIDEYRQALDAWWRLELGDDYEEAAASPVDARIDGDPALAQVLRAEQVTAWRELNQLARGSLQISWDTRTGTPEQLTPHMWFMGQDATAAYADLERRIGPLVDRMLGVGTDDALVLRSTEEFETDDGVGGPERAQVAILRFAREHRSVPVFDDWYQVVLRTSDYGPPGSWVALITAHWMRDAAMPTLASVSDSQAVAIARASGKVAGGSIMEAPQLGIATIDREPRLVWKLSLQEGKTAWGYRVDALSGEIVQSASRSGHNASGTLKAHVGRPGEGASKSPRAVPWANIYEDTKAYTGVAPGCWSGAIAQEQGDADRILGATNYWGAYTDLVGIDPYDTEWTIDYRGEYVQDRSEPSILHHDLFDAGTDWTFPQEATHNRSRRGEIYYLLNYGYAQYYYGSYWIPQFEPLSFYLLDRAPDPWSRCEYPYGNPQECCARSTHWVGCINIECEGIGVASLPSSERDFRQAVFHEQNHTVMEKTGNWCFNCGGTALTDGPECGCWEEGRAMFAAMAMSRFEAASLYWRPNRVYPYHWASDYYYSGSNFTSIYGHVLLKMGVGPAMREVHTNMGSVDTNTRMVGLCTDLNSDGYVTVDECPANSFYRNMLAADQAIWWAKYQHQYELSEVFHAHVADADRATAGVQEFPWADEMPAYRVHPPFLAAEFPNAAGSTIGTVIDSPAPYGGGKLRLNTADDHDTAMFLAREGITYVVETTLLSSGMDTYLEVLDKTGLETILAANDDCGASPRSCITFVPTATGYYRARVRSAVGGATGPNKTYRIRVASQDDDFGDVASGATALAPNNDPRYGVMHSASDVDVFRFVSSTAQTIEFNACTNRADTVKVELLDASSNVLATRVNNWCWPTPGSHAVGPGVYFLHVSHDTGTPGAYWVRAKADADIDIDSTPANAWPLTNDPVEGRLIGTVFEDQEDEDWYKFEAVEGVYYIVETWGVDSGISTWLEVYAPDTTVFGNIGELEAIQEDTSGHGLGHWMLSDVGGALAPGGSRLAFIAPADGTYYVRVQNLYESAGRYYVMFEDTGISSGWVEYP